MSLSTLNFDVLFNIFLCANAEDVISCEQVCRSLRAAASSKAIWLIKFKHLHHTVKPQLPPYVKPESLSSELLRALMRSSLRSYYHMMQGESLYRLVKTVKVKDPFNGRGKIFGRTGERNDSTIKLSPGGRFLFMIHMDSCEEDMVRETLQVYDLENGAECVWAFTSRGFIKSFDFEMLSRDRFRIAIEQKSWLDVEARVSVYTLEFSYGGMSIESIFTRRIDDFGGDEGFVLLSGDFLLFARRRGLIALNWDQGLSRNVKLAPEGDTNDKQVLSAALYQRHAFVFESSATGTRINMRILDLQRLFGGDTSKQDISDYTICSLETYGNTSGFNGDHIHDSISDVHSLTSTRPSIRQIRGEDGNDQILVSLRGQYLSRSNDLEDFLVFTAVFSQGSDTRKPSLMPLAIPKSCRLIKDGPAFDGVASGPLSARSRNLFFLKTHPGRKGFSQMGVICQSQTGSIIFARLPSDITKSIGEEGSHCSWAPFMDPYSDAIICRRMDAGLGGHYVDIFGTV